MKGCQACPQGAVAIHQSITTKYHADELDAPYIAKYLKLPTPYVEWFAGAFDDDLDTSVPHQTDVQRLGLQDGTRVRKALLGA